MTEGAEIGTLVLQVSSTDLDLGLNGKVSKTDWLQHTLRSELLRKLDNTYVLMSCYQFPLSILELRY